MQGLRILYFMVIFSSSNLIFANKLDFFILGGPNFTQLKNQSPVQINDVVSNAYHTTSGNKWQGLWGGGIQHSFEQRLFSAFELSLGFAGYHINLGGISGVESPYVNDAVYDTLNYNFRAKSRAVMVESHFAYTHYDWQPYALIGLGVSWNRLSGYNEIPTDSSLSATPMSPGFASHTHQAFGYELGIGVQHQLFDDSVHKVRCKAGVGYRYFNLGSGQLGGSIVQTSADRLQINHLATQALLFSLNVSLY